MGDLLVYYSSLMHQKPTFLAFIFECGVRSFLSWELPVDPVCRCYTHRSIPSGALQRWVNPACLVLETYAMMSISQRTYASVPVGLVPAGSTVSEKKPGMDQFACHATSRVQFIKQNPSLPVQNYKPRCAYGFDLSFFVSAGHPRDSPKP